MAQLLFLQEIVNYLKSKGETKLLEAFQQTQNESKPVDNVVEKSSCGEVVAGSGLTKEEEDAEYEALLKLQHTAGYQMQQLKNEGIETSPGEEESTKVENTNNGEVSNKDVETNVVSTEPSAEVEGTTPETPNTKSRRLRRASAVAPRINQSELQNTLNAMRTHVKRAPRLRRRGSVTQTMAALEMKIATLMADDNSKQTQAIENIEKARQMALEQQTKGGEAGKLPQLSLVPTGLESTAPKDNNDNEEDTSYKKY